jgi:hypothetical protein
MIIKRAYEPPTVEQLGTLAEITQAVSNMGINDPGGSGSTNKS